MTEQNGTFDRDAARQVLLKHAIDWRGHLGETLDALAGCVRPVPPQTIDRAKALKNAEAALVGYRVSQQLPLTSEVTAVVDAVLALVAPDSRFDTIRALHVNGGWRQFHDGGHYYCLECGGAYPCATIRALDGTPS